LCELKRLFAANHGGEDARGIFRMKDERYVIAIERKCRMGLDAG
jgi:hypothetical protein